MLKDIDVRWSGGGGHDLISGPPASQRQTGPVERQADGGTREKREPPSNRTKPINPVRGGGEESHQAAAAEQKQQDWPSPLNPIDCFAQRKREWAKPVLVRHSPLLPESPANK